MSVVDERADDASVVVRALREILLAAQLSPPPDRRVPRQARPPQLLVGRLQSREEGVDALEECRLVEAARSRQDRYGCPLDAIGKRRFGQLLLPQPPERSLAVRDTHQGRVIVPTQLLAKQGRQERRPGLPKRVAALVFAALHWRRDALLDLAAVCQLRYATAACGNPAHQPRPLQLDQNRGGDADQPGGFTALAQEGGGGAVDRLGQLR